MTDEDENKREQRQEPTQREVFDIMAKSLNMLSLMSDDNKSLPNKYLFVVNNTRSALIVLHNKISSETSVKSLAQFEKLISIYNVIKKISTHMNINSKICSFKQSNQDDLEILFDSLILQVNNIDHKHKTNNQKGNKRSTSLMYAYRSKDINVEELSTEINEYVEDKKGYKPQN